MIYNNLNKRLSGVNMHFYDFCLILIKGEYFNSFQFLRVFNMDKKQKNYSMKTKYFLVLSFQFYMFFRVF